MIRSALRSRAVSSSASAPQGALLTFGTLPITLLVQAASSASVIAPAVAAPVLLERLHASTAYVGVYVAIVYAMAMVSGLYGAALVRRYGPIRASGLSLVISAAGLLATMVPHPFVALAGAVLVGLGYGPITPASSDMLARTTPTARLALVFSVKQTGVPLGGILAGLIVPFVMAWLDVRWALGTMAALCIVALLLAELLRESLDVHRDPIAPLPNLTKALAPLAFVWRHAILRTLSLCALVFSMVQIAITSYAVSFLHDDLGWTIVDAGVVLAIAQTLAMIGRVFWGLVADTVKDGPRRVLLGLATTMAACAVAMTFLRPDTPYVMVVALLSVFAATGVGWNGVFLGTIARVVPLEQAATATAGSLFFNFFGVLAGSPVFGLASSLFGRIGPAYALLVLPLLWTVWMLWRASWKRA